MSRKADIFDAYNLTGDREGLPEWYLFDIRTRLSLVATCLNDLHLSELILDVGCGEGSYLLWLSMRMTANTAIGMDINRDSVNAANAICKRVSARVHFIVADARYLPVRDLSSGMVLCTEVIEHIDDWKMVISELTRVTARKLVITSPSSSNPLFRIVSYLPGNKDLTEKKRSEGHLHEFDVFELRDEIAAYGFEVEIRSVRLLGYPNNVSPWRVLTRSRLTQKLYTTVIGPVDRLLTSHAPCCYLGSTGVFVAVRIRCPQ